MRRFAKTGRRGVLWICLGLCCWLLAAGAQGTQDLLFPAEILRYACPQGGDFTRMEALRGELSKDASERRVTAYAQSLSRRLEVPALGSELSCDVLWVDGEMVDIWNAPVPWGEPLHTGDRRGCVISRGAAARLYGSLDPVGQTLRLEEEELVVRGVWEPPSAPASWGADPGRELVFATADVAPEDQKVQALHFVLPGLSFADGQDAALLALGSVGLPTDGEFADDGTGRGIRRFFVGLTGLGMLLAACLSLLRTAWRKGGDLMMDLRALWEDPNPPPGGKGRLLRRAVPQALAFLGGLALLWLLPVQTPAPPAAYLPTRWSDFGFWPTLVRRLSEALSATRLLGGMRPLIQAQSLSLLCVGFTLLGWVLLARGAYRVRLGAAALPWWQVGLAAACLGLMEPLGAGFCAALGLVVDASLFQVSLPPLWFLLSVLREKTMANPRRALEGGDAPPA